MATLLTQQEVEEQMFNGGLTRAENSMALAEDQGRAATNPYARELLQDYVLPLSQAIQADMAVKRAGVYKSHAALLAGLNPDTVAFLAIRTVVNKILQGETPQRVLAYCIGSTVHSELVLTQIEEAFPELFHTLARDFGRRQTKSERHRMQVFKMQAIKRGMYPVEWPVGSRDKIGMYLLGLVEATGLIDLEADTGRRDKSGKPVARGAELNPQVMKRIMEVKSFVALTMPQYGPCVEPPIDWVSMTSGGFHTRALRRANPTLIRHRSARSEFMRDAKMPAVYKAVNALQRTAWRVNSAILRVALEVAEIFDEGETVKIEGNPKPPSPEWFKEDWTSTLPKEQWPEDKLLALRTWKRGMAEWYTERKLRSVRFGRFYSATRIADMFKDYPAIYFVYFADSRGRMYPMTYGLNPQGSDLQRALIHFSEGLPVDTPEAIRWFHVHGANKFGFDKATLVERQQWVVDRQDLILTFADDPLNNTGWKEADSPLQFLAWCMEYAEWVRDRAGTFVSRIPIAMDGSCNGLQNLSALLRDEIGGLATNLRVTPKMQDIYQYVAAATMARLCSTHSPDEKKERLRGMWVEHGVTRSVVKRAVMTTPYGVTKRTATDYVVEDYLRKYPNNFDSSEYMAAAGVLMDAVWPAIGDTVVKGREAMEWLRKCARKIVQGFDDDSDPVIAWLSPSGFPAVQSYYVSQVHRIPCLLHGLHLIRVLTEGADPDLNKHANGLAPNFVHSMDAAHLHLTTAACADLGIKSLAMVHDDYGVHAANAEVLAREIRAQFVAMYERSDPIQELHAKYPATPVPPTSGTLDIREVLNSAYFFS